MDDLETRLTTALPNDANDGYWRNHIKGELGKVIDHLSIGDIIWELAEVALYKHETTEDPEWLEDHATLQNIAECLYR